MRSTQQLTAEQEAQAQELASLVSEAIASDVLDMARLLVGKDTRHTFGQTELHLRDLLLKAGARALEISLAQKKLGWQTWAENAFFKVVEVTLGVAAEAALLAAAFPAPV
jgi:hypothetical protein